MNEKQAVMAEPSREAGEVERTRSERYYSPDVDIVETDGEMMVLADIPGADDQSVDITLENDVLRLEAKVGERDPGNRSPAILEYGVGSFARSFLITDDVDRKAIEATVKNGVLRVRLPKVHEARTRKIAVKKE